MPNPLRRIPKLWLIVLTVVVILLVVATVMVRRDYDQNLQPVSDSQKTSLVTIKTGSSAGQIATQLKDQGLIRSSWAFDWYVRSHQELDQLQAGTYAFSPSQSVQQIVGVLSKGTITTKLVTILPDRRLDQVRADLINSGFAPAAVDAALAPAQYSPLTVLAYKPTDVNTLEGLLYPDSFQKTAATDPTIIIGESLNEMGQHLTPDLQAAFAKEGLSVYQGIILASMVQQEVKTPTDQAQAAQVFLKRLSLGMTLGSDQTAFYGAIVNNQAPSVSFDSLYNTLLHTGLPPTPISNVNDQALNAAAHPATTSWLYFVTGDDGTTYFEQTAQQHQSDINQYCHKLCAADSQ